jgi:polysaccharide biosynthesis transport protein
MNMMQDDFTETEEPGILSALPSILWQRRWLLIVPTIVVTALGIAVALLMHPVYESSATVLIESEQLPGDVANQSMNDMIDQRIARARERVLSRMDLIRLIRANNLYPDQQRSKPLSKIVDEMRDATTITALSADVRPGMTMLRGGSSSIALKIAFQYDDPDKAQVVAQQFVNRFLEVDANAQAEQATGAANFLGDQAASLQNQIAAIDAEVTRIKADNGTLLTLGQISTGDPTADAARIDSDIARLQSENARLSTATSTAAPDSGVAQATAQLRAAEARYSDTHPDVVAARAQLEAARRDAAANAQSVSPAASEIAGNRAQIASLRNAKALLLSQSASTKNAQARAPAIVERVSQLQKQADALRDQYRTIGTRLQGAQIAARVQTEQKGERLTLADPPVVPDAPSKPNRPLIIAGAVAGGLALGLAIILLLELLLQPIRGTAAATAATGAPPLTIVPDFDRRQNPLMRLVEWLNRRKLART